MGGAVFWNFSSMWCHVNRKEKKKDNKYEKINLCEKLQQRLDIMNDSASDSSYTLLIRTETQLISLS